MLRVKCVPPSKRVHFGADTESVPSPWFLEEIPNVTSNLISTALNRERNALEFNHEQELLSNQIMGSSIQHGWSDALLSQVCKNLNLGNREDLQWGDKSLCKCGDNHIHRRHVKAHGGIDGIDGIDDVFVVKPESCKHWLDNFEGGKEHRVAPCDENWKFDISFYVDNKGKVTSRAKSLDTEFFSGQPRELKSVDVGFDSKGRKLAVLPVTSHLVGQRGSQSFAQASRVFTSGLLAIPDADPCLATFLESAAAASAQLPAIPFKSGWMD